MVKTGIIRRFDDLGRIAVPKRSKKTSIWQNRFGKCSNGILLWKRWNNYYEASKRNGHELIVLYGK